MRITALTLNGFGGWPALELSPVMLGLNVVYGRLGSGKTAVADFLAHALYGQPPTLTAAAPHRDLRDAPEGEAIVESDGRRYRLRRYRSGSTSRLTVSSLDGSSVDHETVQRMLGGMSPTLLRRLCAINFRQPLSIESLLSRELSGEFQAIGLGRQNGGGLRTAELLARRDTLAKELETRLADEGRASRDLDGRRRELDRLIAEGEREGTAIEQGYRNVEAALTETDTRLRYRRLEMNAERDWQSSEPAEWKSRLAELDEQVARWRAALADLASREATVRARLAQAQSSGSDAAAVATDQRAWLVVARQLAADLSGEVARLARASTSNQCVCRDAHPRLRPVVETIQRQLDVLGGLVEEQEQALAAAELETEVGHLARSQAELGRQLEHLLDRRQTLARGTSPSRRPLGWKSMATMEAHGQMEVGEPSAWFTAADAEQLESRRHELEEERFELVNRLAAHDRRLRDLRAQRATVERQRAGLLSARSIEHMQRELAAVQQKLQQAAQTDVTRGMTPLSAENSPRASDILAKLTDGRLVRLQLVDHGRGSRVWTRDGAVLGLESLSPAERDQVVLSFSLALAAATERQAVRLPLLLDEPFLRLNASETAALAAVLDDLGRHGQQVLVFTGQPEAARRMASLGAPVFDIEDLRRREQFPSGLADAVHATQPQSSAAQPIGVRKPKPNGRKGKSGKRLKVRPVATPTNAPTNTDHSDAA